MIKAFLFLWKYKILKDPVNLSYHTKEFFELSKKTQRKVLDQYFNKLDPNFPIESYFNDKASRYYQDNQEITFFSCYYFDKSIIELNPTNIKLIDKFKLTEEKIDYLMNYTLELLESENIKLKIEELLTYPDNLPIHISKNIEMMSYLTKLNCYHIKYITYNDKCASRQRELIQLSLVDARKKPFSIKNYLKSDGTLPNILSTNIDFILYLIENDIHFVKYLTEKLLTSITPTHRKLITKTIMETLNKSPNSFSVVEENLELATYLNQDEDFISYLIQEDIANIHYIDWHNLTDTTRTKMIHKITTQLIQKQKNIDIMKYPFHNLFFQNYSFMKYLVEQDFRWIAVERLNKKEESDQLIESFFEQIKNKHYTFKLEDFLEDGKHMNHHLIENQKMLTYFIQNKVPIIKYIDFFHLEHPKNVVENILKEIEKKDYEFHNEEFLINGKYPIPLSNSYRFMRLVIDKNFNNLAYIDLSMMDPRELKRIINYAFRMVYYIRGTNHQLNFDLDGYFKNSDIITNEYFQECLKSL